MNQILKHLEYFQLYMHHKIIKQIFGSWRIKINGLQQMHHLNYMNGIYKMKLLLIYIKVIK